MTNLLQRALLAASAVLTLGGGPPPTRHAPAFLMEDIAWADSVMAMLGPRERIAQLMMVAAYSNRDAKHVAEVDRLVRDHGVGGLIFFQGGPVRQAHLTNRWQAAARVPLLVGMDLEWGLAMRLDSTVRFPKQMTLGALRNDDAIEEMGREIARQMQRLGVHVSFSPVADVNNNPANPVINDRSFGEERELVARKAVAYMRGLQAGGVIATAKHFPGHGDTDADSHHALPLIAHPRGRLDSLELYPFQRLMEEGLSAIMVAHLEVPALDSTPGLPSTLSRPVVNELLERELGFQGLVFTDALNMKGVANADKPGEIELRALLAGNDVLLFPQDPVKAIDRILQAVDSGLVPHELIDHKCRKVLRAKRWAGLHQRPVVRTEGLAEDLNAPAARVLRRTLFGQALTALRSRDGLLPIADPGSLRIAALAFGDSAGNAFHRHLARHARITSIGVPKDLHRDSLAGLLRRLEGHDLVIASVHRTSYRVDKDFGAPDRVFEVLRQVQRDHRTVLAWFGNPYRLTRAYGSSELDGLLVGYEDDPDVHDLCAQALFGARSAGGTLPVTASAQFEAGHGLSWEALPGRITYGLPEEAGLRTTDLIGIDAIVQEGIAAKAFPGAQVLVAVDGHVVWDKAYGKPTYDGKRSVRTDDLYDLASITKVAATTLAVMKLVDEGRIDMDRDLGTYLSELNGAHEGHARLGLREVLTHQAGLRDWVPFHQRLLSNKEPRPGVVAEKVDSAHALRVAERTYISAGYRDSLAGWILGPPLNPVKEYKYSDLGLLLIQRVVERVAGTTLDRYVDSVFYRPLALDRLGYTPLQRVLRRRIAPTEYDPEFRRQQVWGDVHDPTAALLGGVAGHAGLFSNAEDLFVVFQLLLNKGVHNGRRYLSEAVVDEFTRCQFCAPEPRTGENRRGLGFDKPVRGKGGPTCSCVSYASFGHTGFTGTMAWADPEQRIVYIFLSNRVYPTAANKALSEMNIRTRIQEVVHAAVAARMR
ncbi:MAG TPA: glycoside hydrolase family 3 N-terminal domain-containing protein [Flavobacteriales bacterium]|nr:glycoside hydrolase family 3 N-terminal domain-containing protein [Flavobacteriales bacterium]HMR26048.1 glycoside hydrolase family 3 N-terminal domain-containing protein [Flavobacteriales bacterium]